MNAEDNNASSAAAAERCGSRAQNVSPSAIAARLIQAYQTRNALFGGDLFNTAAWEILLLLQMAEEGLTEAELQRLSNAPLAAMQRWIGVLEGREMVSAGVDAEERSVYALTASARADLAEVLRSTLPQPQD